MAGALAQVTTASNHPRHPFPPHLCPLLLLLCLLCRFRSGRTARGAGKEGVAIALVAPREAQRFVGLARALDRGMPPHFPIDDALMPQVPAAACCVRVRCVRSRMRASCARICARVCKGLPWTGLPLRNLQPAQSKARLCTERSDACNALMPLQRLCPAPARPPALQVKARVKLALRLDELERAVRKKHAEDTWRRASAKVGACPCVYVRARVRVRVYARARVPAHARACCCCAVQPLCHVAAAVPPRTSPMSPACLPSAPSPQHALGCPLPPLRPWTSSSAMTMGRAPTAVARTAMKRATGAAAGGRPAAAGPAAPRRRRCGSSWRRCWRSRCSPR